MGAWNNVNSHPTTGDQDAYKLCCQSEIENRNLRLIIVNTVFPSSQLAILKNLTCNSLHSWYFGKLTREQSEAILQKYGPGRFLVRNSESVHKPGAYTLSLK